MSHQQGDTIIQYEIIIIIVEFKKCTSLCRNELSALFSGGFFSKSKLENSLPV